MSTAAGAVQFKPARQRLGVVSQCWRFCRHKPLGAAGAVILTGMVLLAVFAPVVSPYGEYETNYKAIRVAPGAAHILGTDEFGRDLFTRIVWGARISLYVSGLAVGLGMTAGALIGLSGAFWGGVVDLISQRLLEVLMAFPMLVMALAIVAALGSSIDNVVFALAVVLVPQGARVVRSAALTTREADYVQAARAIGAKDLRILFHHVLPNCIAPYIIVLTAGLGWAILVEASLSFLGLGVPQPEPSWGGMLSGAGRQYVVTAPWMAVFPGLAISLAVFGFNFFGDALRDVLDPRLRL